MNAAKEAISSGDPKNLVELQHKCIKSACEKSINNAKEFADMAHDTSGKIIEAMNNITDQVAKNFAKATKKNLKNVKDRSSKLHLAFGQKFKELVSLDWSLSIPA